MLLFNMPDYVLPLYITYYTVFLELTIYSLKVNKTRLISGFFKVFLYFF